MEASFAAPNILVPIVMFGSNLIFLILFGLLPPRRALLVSFFGAWLFLPVYTYENEGLPDYSKLFAICSGIMLAVVIFDFKRLTRYRPKPVDIPILLWCLAPVFSSMTNGLGFRDGASEALDQIILWGVPYFLGRIYFTDWEGMTELAKAALVSGLTYVPFILFEMIMSPQLHRITYGFHQHKFDQTYRFGLWRPMVFMHHGLMVAFWMMAVAVIAVWIWRSGAIKQISHERLPFSFSFGWVAAGFVLITIFSVSVNAWLWLSIGLTVLGISNFFRTRIPVILIMLFIPFYIVTQGTSVWPGETAVDFAVGLFGPERAQSLEFRYDNEELLSEKAREQWVFGWAGWGRQLVKQKWGPTTVPDSLWVIVFGKFGAFGMIGLVLSLLLPTIIFIYRYPPWIWAHPNIAPTAAMAVILVMYMFDGLLNAMINPLFMLIAGGMLGTFVNLPPLEKQIQTVSPRRVQQAPALGD